MKKTFYAIQNNNGNYLDCMFQQTELRDDIPWTCDEEVALVEDSEAAAQHYLDLYVRPRLPNGITCAVVELEFDDD